MEQILANLARDFPAAAASLQASSNKGSEDALLLEGLEEESDDDEGPSPHLCQTNLVADKQILLNTLSFAFHTEVVHLPSV